MTHRGTKKSHSIPWELENQARREQGLRRKECLMERRSKGKCWAHLKVESIGCVRLTAERQVRRVGE